MLEKFKPKVSILTFGYYNNMVKDMNIEPTFTTTFTEITHKTKRIYVLCSTESLVNNNYNIIVIRSGLKKGLRNNILTMPVSRHCESNIFLFSTLTTIFSESMEVKVTELPSFVDCLINVKYQKT